LEVLCCFEVLVILCCVVKSRAVVTNRLSCLLFYKGVDFSVFSPQCVGVVVTKRIQILNVTSTNTEHTSTIPSKHVAFRSSTQSNDGGICQRWGGGGGGKPHPSQCPGTVVGAPTGRFETRNVLFRALSLLGLRTCEDILPQGILPHSVALGVPQGQGPPLLLWGGTWGLRLLEPPLWGIPRED